MKVCKQASNNNSGMTLIELIVAIFILSLIVVPLFLSFATSANVTYRSREIGDATLTAENIAEYIIGSDFSAESVAMVQSGLDTSFGVTGTTTQAVVTAADGATTLENIADTSLLFGSVVGTDTDPRDTFQITMDNIEVGTTTLDAVVTLDRVEGEATAINQVPLTDSAQADCMFAQPKGAGITTDPDVLSFKDFISAAKLAGKSITTATYDDAAIKALAPALKVDRTMEIGITKGAYGASNTEVEWEILIIYSYEYAYTSGGSTFTYDTSYEVISDSFVVAVDEWPNIQVLFYPWYHGEENIHVVNNDVNDAKVAKFNLYLVKQQHESADLKTWETSYGVNTSNKIDARLYNDLTLLEEPNIYSNLGTRFTDSGTTDILNGTYYRIFKRDFFYTQAEFASIDSIVAESARKRYYNVTVALTVDGDTTPTYELKTTKLQ